MPTSVQTPEKTEAAMQAFFEASALLDPLRLMIWDRQNLTVTQLRLLNHLLQDEGLGNAELAERLYVTRPSVSALLERLERGHYIRREVSPNDRRGIRIYLEEKGREVLECVSAEAREYMTRLMASLSDEDLEQLHSSLTKLVESGRQQHARELESQNVEE